MRAPSSGHDRRKLQDATGRRWHCLEPDLRLQAQADHPDLTGPGTPDQPPQGALTTVAVTPVVLADAPRQAGARRIRHRRTPCPPPPGHGPDPTSSDANGATPTKPWWKRWWGITMSPNQSSSRVPNRSRTSNRRRRLRSRWPPGSPTRCGPRRASPRQACSQSRRPRRPSGPAVAHDPYRVVEAAPPAGSACSRNGSTPTANPCSIPMVHRPALDRSHEARLDAVRPTALDRSASRLQGCCSHQMASASW